MKIVTILGTRPEIIRLSRVISILDTTCKHILVHTGQNFDDGLSKVFFEELGVRAPDFFFGAEPFSLAKQVAQIFLATETLIDHECPDRILILGDTNSALAAIVAKRKGVPVYHMEAGNRCYDDRVPEEVNRRIIDHSSDILMPYTERSRVNLLREGIEGIRVFVIGNPIFEVLQHFQSRIEKSPVLERLKLKPNDYFLATMHRAENVDVQPRLVALVNNLTNIAREYDVPVICSLHPRTASKLNSYGITHDPKLVRMLPPFGFFDFVALQKYARCVLTDSGTVQEECCILHVPNVTLRDTTERPETLECGSNVLCGMDGEILLRAVRLAVSADKNWTVPPEYLVPCVSRTVAKIITGYDHTLACRG